MVKGRVSQLLEASLRCWEDWSLYTSSMRKGEMEGAAPKWHEFRSYLLKNRGGDFDTTRFKRISHGDNYKQYDPFVRHLTAWTLSSRRVFTLTAEMAEVFGEMSYEGVRWEDLPLPFDSFIIQLDPAFQIKAKDGPDSGMEVPLFMISRMRGRFNLYPESSEDAVEILGVADHLDNIGKIDRLLTYSEREALKNCVQRGKWDAAFHRAGRIADRLQLDSHQEILLSQPIELDAVRVAKQDLVEEPQSGDPTGVHARKILAGLCLYLRCLPPQVREERVLHAPTVAAPTSVLRVITDGQHVCDVLGLNSISPRTLGSMRKVVRKIGYEVKPHARCSYFRRARGLGKDPAAPRTIYVAPTIVRRDKIPSEGVLEGSTSVVK